MIRLLNLGSLMSAACLILTVQAAGAVDVQLESAPYITGLVRPSFVTHAGDGSGRLFILERDGRIRIWRPGAGLQAEPFLNIVPKVSNGSEQGLLGLAFHPNYAQNGRFFIHYTNLGDQVVIAEYHRSAGNPDLADGAETVLMTMAPKIQGGQGYHNGGMMEFGPDGYLYIGVGDGGNSVNAQNLDNLLGKILRIDVDSGSPYGVPGDNPFVGTAGRDEIYAYGLRNPWRFSFDALGRLICADVGEENWEEIDIIESGGNYGWYFLEGNECWDPPVDCNRTGKIPPIFVYDHASGNCSITGGYAYRGRRVPGLTGKYVFADFCSGRIWTLEETAPGAWTRTLLLDAPFQITTFGEDESGELLVCEYHDAGQADGGFWRFVDLSTAVRDFAVYE